MMVSESKNYRVVLADDHAVFRQGLMALLEREGIDVVGEASDGGEALRLLNDIRPSLALLDLSMPVMSGLEVARELNVTAPEIRIILLTMHMEDAYVMEALRIGVWGYVLKSRSAREVFNAIEQVSNGSVYLSTEVSETVVRSSRMNDASYADALSGRESQVLKLIAEGASTKDIAGLLGVSGRTVESHRGRIMRKLDIHNTANLVRFAVRNGLIQA